MVACAGTEASSVYVFSWWRLYGCRPSGTLGFKVDMGADINEIYWPLFFKRVIQLH